MSLFRRTSSPDPHLAKSESSSISHECANRTDSLNNAWHVVQNLLHGLHLLQAFIPKERLWHRGFISFFTCFLLGFIIGSAMNISDPIRARDDLGIQIENPIQFTYLKSKASASDEDTQDNSLLIVVTTTGAGPLQGYYLSSLAQTLRLVPSPLLWIVVEKKCQSLETYDLLRKRGLMYRHLAYVDKEVADVEKRNNVSVDVLRNAALSHIEKHRFDAIVFFASEDSVYRTELFDLMRKIRRISMWRVAKVRGGKGETWEQGPICDGSRTMKMPNSMHNVGFAFNSTILWDPSRWNMSTNKPIRLSEKMNEEHRAISFIWQMVENADQIECLASASSGIMAWALD